VDKKGQTLALEIEDDLPLMSSDAGKLRQVLYNLLSNAHKYTPEGGAIRLEAQRLGSDRVRLIVEDNGPGIAEEDQERIFEKFRQLDSSVTREHSGTGLGLAISRELCGLLGGTIRLDSRPGHGARFTVDVPVEAPENVIRPLPSLT
jgi:signal transduction histidine kinase